MGIKKNFLRVIEIVLIKRGISILQTFEPVGYKAIVFRNKLNKMYESQL